MCETATSSSILNWNVAWTVYKDSSRLRRRERGIPRFFKHWIFEISKRLIIKISLRVSKFFKLLKLKRKNQIFILFLQFPKLLNIQIVFTNFLFLKINSKLTNSKYRFFQPSHQINYKFGTTWNRILSLSLEALASITIPSHHYLTAQQSNLISIISIKTTKNQGRRETYRNAKLFFVLFLW